MRYPSDNIGNDKFVLRVFGILEKESIGIPFVRVSPPFYNIPHFGSEHRPYFPYMVGRVRCLGAYKADFTVHDVPIPQEKHIPEIDSVAQVGENQKSRYFSTVLLPLYVTTFLSVPSSRLTFGCCRSESRTFPAERVLGFFQNPVAPCVIHHAFKGFHIEIYGGDGLALVPQELVKA